VACQSVINNERGRQLLMRQSVTVIMTMMLMMINAMAVLLFIYNFIPHSLKCI